MKNKLKEMLLQHKPITEQNSDIDDIWGETVVDGAEDFEEIPEEVEDAEEVVEDVPAEEVEDAEVEEDVEDVAAEEDSHTIADAIEESFLIPKSLKMKYHNSRINANTKKVNKNLDKLEKAKKEWGNNPVGADTIDKLKAKVDNKATKLDAHTDKYKEVHDKKHEGLAKKTLYKPGKLEKMIKDPRKLNKIANPSMFAAQAENRAKTDNETIDRLVKTTSKHRDDQAKHTKELKQAGNAPEHKEEPKVAPKAAPKAMPTTRVAPTTVQTPHQKVASNAAAVKERLSKVRSIM